jgi:nucleotide-binding universal stress UspA family protein
MSTRVVEKIAFQRVLLTLDGSPFAEAALPAALTLARKMNGELRLLSALEVPPILVYPEFRSDDRIGAEKYLQDVAKRATHGWDGEVTTVVREGRVGDEITREAAEWSADVLVMATHGRGGLARAWLGSVADHCIRKAERPVLLVRPPEADPRIPANWLRVVVPLDGSESSEAALPHAIELGEQLGIPITLVRVVTYMNAPEYPWVPLTVQLNERLIASEKNEAEGYLKGLFDRLGGHGVTVTARVVTGVHPAHAIIAEARTDLIVMTRQGLGRLDRAIFGSVSDQVVRAAEGAVMIIPPGRFPRSEELE